MEEPHPIWGMCLQLCRVPPQGSRCLLPAPVHWFYINFRIAQVLQFSISRRFHMFYIFLDFTGFLNLWVLQVFGHYSFSHRLHVSRSFTGFIISSFHMYICHTLNEFVGFIGFEVIQLWEGNVYRLRQSFM